MNDLKLQKEDSENRLIIALQRKLKQQNEYIEKFVGDLEAQKQKHEYAIQKMQKELDENKNIVEEQEAQIHNIKSQLIKMTQQNEQFEKLQKQNDIIDFAQKITQLHNAN